jgi:hypothetical protein
LTALRLEPSLEFTNLNTVNPHCMGNIFDGLFTLIDEAGSYPYGAAPANAVGANVSSRSMRSFEPRSLNTRFRGIPDFEFWLKFHPLGAS